MKRKEQYADEIIEMLELTKCGGWASNINLNTKDRVIKVCQNVVDSWSGRKFKNHCTTSPQALEQEPRWIPVSDRLPDKNMACLVAVGKFNLTQTAMYSDLMGIMNHRIFYQGDYGNDNFENITQYVNAWMPLPKTYEPQESEGKE